MIPCYNEQEVITHTVKTVLQLLETLVDQGLCSTDDSGVLLVDDGSVDRTWFLLEELSRECSRVRAIRLSRNRGHQVALLAGLLEVRRYADLSISLDADLQDDLSLCAQMLHLAADGVEIVYGVRHERSVDPFAKRLWAFLFYRVASRFGIQGIPGHADFRMLTSRVLRAIAEYPERSLYLRGLIPLLGFASATLPYTRQPRHRGTSKYPFRASLGLAIDAVVSLSDYPLRLIAWSGLVIAGFAVLALIVLLIRYSLGGTVIGWTSIMVVVIAAAGLQMLALGVIGEYLSRIYREVKRRPRFHVRDRLGT